jgi:hypothetical protein
VVLITLSCSIAAAAPFSSLRRFHEGRGIKQWTGDDLKALMKVDLRSIRRFRYNVKHMQVYIPAIEGHVPREMVQTFRAFMESCYTARRNVHDTQSLAALSDALERFHKHRVIFTECGVRTDGFALRRQHSLSHYPVLIRAFGALNGLCSSITESKHIKALKESWRRSNRFESLGPMLVTNQRLDKLAASRVDFTKRGMLNGTCLESARAALSTYLRIWFVLALIKSCL